MDAAFRLPTLPRSQAKPMLTFGVIAGHVVLLWALMHLGVVENVVRAAQPLAVRLVAAPDAPRPPPERLPEPPKPQPPVRVPLVAPPVVVETVVPVSVPRDAVPVEAAPAPQPAPAIVVAAAPPAPPPPPPVAVPHKVPASALRYRVEPPVAVPRLSRRLRETGTVVLHVVVDLQGLPRSVSVRQSSGHARLDEQALSAMRQARFIPCTADGKPVECESDAPIVYELEN